MRWFRGNTEAPKLLSLSPLRGDDDGNGLHFRSRSRDMSSPVRWPRRKSSSPESERNCYNVRTLQVTTEKCYSSSSSSNKKDKKKIQEERRRFCEKRNPLLDKVKNTRLSFFKDKSNDENLNDDNHDDDDDGDKSQCQSMCDLGKSELTRNDFRRSVCEIDLKKITEKEKTQAIRKRRSKSHTRIPTKKNIEDKFSFLGFGSSNSSKTRKSFNDDKNILKDYTESKKSVDITTTDNQDLPLDDNTQLDNVSSSSCIAAKFRAMQDRYIKNSTNKLIAKIYRRDGKDNDKRRLRSFSYGALPGLEELRTNPLFEDHNQDDNDSGILDSGSATSSLLDDRCGSGASGLITSMTNDSLPPQIPPRKPSSFINDLDRNIGSSTDLGTSEFNKKSNRDIQKNHSRMTVHNLSLGIEKDPLNSIYQIKNNELVQKNIIHSESSFKEKQKYNEKDSSKQLKVVRSSSCKKETIIVKLIREFFDQSLGIFIAKNTDSNNGYLVAHVVPNGLADKEGTLKIGDEILIVNGKRLRGLDMSDARRVLGSGSSPGDVDIVISRFINNEQPKKLKESSVDYENVCMDNGHGIIVESTTDSPKSHFKKHNPRHHRDKKNESGRSISSDKCRAINDGTPQTVSNFCTLPRRLKSSVTTFHTVVFEKGPGKKSLGFTIVGGRDCPKGSIGIFIKSVLPGGQAAEDGRLRGGDEILAINGQVSHDLTHREAVQLFRNIKCGSLALHVCRRVKQVQSIKAKSCADLLIVDA